MVAGTIPLRLDPSRIQSASARNFADFPQGGLLMTFDELQQTLSAILESGQLGVPVAVRMSSQVADPHVRLERIIERAMALVQTVLTAAPLRLAATVSGDQRQVSLLVQHAGGQTASMTAGCGQRGNSLQLLVIGSRGLVRLEGGEWFAPDGMENAPPSAASQDWERAITESRTQGGFVPLNAGPSQTV